MHRVILLRIGGKKLHLLKMTGALVVVGAALGVLGTVSSMFRIIKQLELAQSSTELAIQVFGLLPSALSGDLMLGYFMIPSAWFMFWLALFIAGAILYRSGSIILPIEEEIDVEKKKA